jgi:hypothetical protein
VSEPDLASALLAVAAGIMMVRVASMKKMLEFRRQPTVCASCGRAYKGRNCTLCARD